MLGRLPEAGIVLDRAIEIDPSNANAWALKGQVIIITGKYRMAELCFDSSLRLEPLKIDDLDQ